MINKSMLREKPNGLLIEPDPRYSGGHNNTLRSRFAL